MNFGEMVESRLSELGETVNSFEARQGWRQGYLRTVVRKDAKRTVPNIERAREICDALGLEFYIGPDRPRQTATGFAEAAMSMIEPSVDGNTEALRMGFMPIPFHRNDTRHKGVSPIALARAWLRDKGLKPDDLSFVAAPNDDMAPTINPGDLLLINGEHRPSSDAALSVFCCHRTLGIGWTVKPTDHKVVVFFERKYASPLVCNLSPVTGYSHLGEVVARFDGLPLPWIGNQERSAFMRQAKQMVAPQAPEIRIEPT